MYRTDSSSDASGSDPQDPRRRRLWMVLAAAAGVLFIVAVVPSARQDATPVPSAPSRRQLHGSACRSAPTRDNMNSGALACAEFYSYVP
jgi:hypothetical protein